MARGDRVRVLDNLSTGHMSNLASVRGRVELVEGDLVDSAAVTRAVAGVDYVFHQAALASVPMSVEHPLKTHAACVTGTLQLLDAARKAQVKRLVYAASSSAYGDTPFAAKRETDLPLPISPYGAAKLAAEQYCQVFTRTYGFPTVSVRYFNVFGPRQDPASPYSAVIPLFVTAMLEGKRPRVNGSGQQSRDFTYVANIVQGNLLAAEAAGAEGQVFNVAMGRSITLLELIGTLNRLLGTSIDPDFGPPREGDILESLADISEARRVLGYHPQVSFLEGLERSIAYYRGIAEQTLAGRATSKVR